MMPASSNSLTVRYTVEIEILSSTATQRRYNSSTAGWWTASARTRAITPRGSVLRRPVAAQRASMAEVFAAEGDFSVVIGSPFATSAADLTFASAPPPALHSECQIHAALELIFASVPLVLTFARVIAAI